MPFFQTTVAGNWIPLDILALRNLYLHILNIKIYNLKQILSDDSVMTETLQMYISI